MKFEEYLDEALASVKDVTVDDSKYVAAHGKKPKGEGNWVIDVGGKDVSFNGGLVLAITKAKRVAKQDEVTKVVIKP